MKGTIPSIFTENPALLEFATTYVTFVYDSCINDFISICQEQEHNQVEKSLGEIIKLFSDEQQIAAIKRLAQEVTFYVGALFLNYLDCHDEFKILIAQEEDRVELSSICTSLKNEIMGYEGLLHCISEYGEVEMPLELIEYRIEGDPPAISPEIPHYYVCRPALMHFADTVVREVYDYSIKRVYESFEYPYKKKPVIKCPPELCLLPENQLSAIKQLIQMWIYTFVLKATGIFESSDFWLLAFQDGQYVHISYTDLDNQDFERNELSFDMHDTAEDGIINVFSKYGVPKE